MDGNSAFHEESPDSGACPRCGSATARGARFCRSCGVDLGRFASRRCVSCDSPFQEGARFCRNCGSPVAGPNPSDRQQASHQPTVPLATARSGFERFRRSIPTSTVFICVAAIALLGAGVVIALAAGSSSGKHADAVFGPATTAVSTGAGVESVEPSTETPTTETGVGSAEGREETGLEAYAGPGYNLRFPSGWESVEDGVQKEGYEESRWRNPVNRGDFALIDNSPGSGESPEAVAAPVHHTLEREHGYEEVSYEATQLGETPAWEWVFRLPGSERVDYFFERCGTGFAVLGSSAPARFAALEPTFRAMAESVRGSCE